MDLSTISLLDNYPIPSISFIKVDDNNQMDFFDINQQLHSHINSGRRESHWLPTPN